ncbi:MAG: hypothetical protein RL077_1899 [Verrucomicrobiota bacterium]
MGPDATALSHVQVRTFKRRYEAIIEDAHRQNPLAPSARTKKRGPQKKSKPRNLIERLDKHRSQVRAFLTDFRVPFDNNQAERAIRMMKVLQKIAGLFRSEDGAKVLCRIRRLYFHRAQERRGCRRKGSAPSAVRKGRLLTQSRAVDWADQFGHRARGDRYS